MKRLPVFLSVLACQLLVIGCSPTPYQPLATAGGYSDTRYAPDVAKITFNGNGYTSAAMAQDFSLLRAADLCLQSGYKYFLVGGDNVETSTSSYTTAGSSYTTGSAYGTGAGGVGYSQNTSTIPGQTIVINKPEAFILVKFFKTKPTGVSVFDAVFIQNSLKSKYKLP
jgi:hypothetical protein